MPFALIALANLSLFVGLFFVNMNMLSADLKKQEFRCGMPLVGLFIVECFFFVVLVVTIGVQIALRNPIRIKHRDSQQ